MVRKGSQENLDDVVADEHLDKCGKCVLTDVLATKSYNHEGDEIW